jgi:hypothetical protein
MAFYQNGQSKLKMVALMPPNEKNITWYSPIWQNHKNNETIIEGMLQRFKKQDASKRVAVYQFYENEVKVFELKRP